MGCLDREERKQWIKHVEYEWAMLCYAFGVLSALRHEPSGCKMMRNAYLECFLLHFRNLYEFLFEPRKKKDDLRASDWIPDWLTIVESEPKLRDIKESLKTKYYDECHKRLAHLTRTRTDEYEWEISIPFRKIEFAYRRFQQLVETQAQRGDNQDMA
ncbi:MAG: hypothetical protein NZ924_04280 [Candidatus Bipolaricaulota bacterium]|nr:hypothetical protein [Candidatus Bipolaricaulota bacterium]MDW8152112.1 hypothetical protein [Candidatus Bipolaricaulota bacterium]